MDLVDMWGLKHNLTDKDILEAVRQHMFHEDGNEKGELRFSISEDKVGNVLIRVLPKRRQTPQFSVPEPIQFRAHTKAPGNASAQGHAPPWRQVDRRAARTVLRPGRNASEEPAVKRPSSPESPSHRLSLEEKLDMSLDEVSRFTRDHCAESPRHHWSGRQAEETQKWIAWVLKGGHEKMGIEMTRGWVRCEALVSGMKGLSGWPRDARELQKFIELTDKVGRFDINLGRLRLVAHGERRPRVSPAAREPSRKTATESETEGSPPAPPSCSMRRRSHSNSSSSSSLRDEPRSALDVKAVPRKEDITVPRPLLPVQDTAHWTQFEDNGSAWWYYEGPLGTWYTHGDGGVGSELAVYDQ